MHGQRTDVAAGKEDGIDGEGIGAHGHGAGNLKQGRIIQPPQDFIVQMAEKKLADEPVRCTAAASVIKKNPFRHKTISGGRS